MKKDIVLLIILSLNFLFNGTAQVSNYTFTQTTGTYTPIIGGTLIANGTADDSLYTALPLGFNFNYNGTNYNTFGLNINGWICLGSIAPVNSYNPISDGANNNVISILGRDIQLGFTSNGNYTSGSHVINNMGSTVGYTVGDVLQTHAGFPAGTTITAITSSTITVSNPATTTGVSTYEVNGNFRYGILGTSPNRICVLQWTRARRYGTTISEGRNDYFNFQIRLFETTNEIKFSFGNFQANTTAATYEVGLTGSNNSDYNNRQTASNWASSNAGTNNSSTCTLSSTIKPATGLTYTWTPAAGCTGSPVAGTATGPSTVCSGENFTLTLSGYSPSSPYLGLQWQQSNSLNGVYSNINGATSNTYTTSQTSDTYYRCVVTCGSSSVNSNVVSVALNTNSSSCYCIPPPSDCSWDDLINSVTFVTIDTFTGCANNTGYSFYSTPIPNIYRTQTYPITVSVGTEAATDQIGVWIDYDQSGTFDANEFIVFGSGNDYITSSITVPGTAVLGNTRMRIRARSVDVTLTGTDACTAFSDGETEDYLVNICDNALSNHEVAEENTISIFPNPAHNFINVYSNSATNEVYISIDDLQGKTLINYSEKEQLKELKKQIDISNLPQGMYLLTIRTEKSIKMSKIAIQ